VLMGAGDAAVNLGGDVVWRGAGPDACAALAAALPKLASDGDAGSSR